MHTELMLLSQRMLVIERDSCRIEVPVVILCGSDDLLIRFIFVGPNESQDAYRGTSFVLLHVDDQTRL